MGDEIVFCRSCMQQLPKTSDGDIKFYDIFQTLDLATKLIQCSNLPLQSNDEFPKSICESCYIKVMEFSEFQRVYRDALQKFKQLLWLEKSAETSEYIECGTSASAYQVQENTQGQVHRYCMDLLEADDLVEEVVNDIDYNAHIEEPLVHNYSETIKMLSEDSEKPKTMDSLTLESNCLPVEKSLSLQTFFEDLNDTEEDCIIDTVSDDDGELGSQQNIYSLDQHFTPSGNCLTAHKRVYSCSREKCTESFSRLCDLRQHLRLHDNNRDIYKCDVDNCGEEFTTKSAINIHMRKQHNFGAIPGTRKFICDICDAVLGNERCLRYHHYIHVDKSLWPFACDIIGCSDRFRKLSQLKDHKYRHGGVKPYVCPHCDKRFCTSSNLSAHLNYHTKEKTWPCKDCDKLFSNATKFKLHMKKYHDQQEIQYPCRMCGKKLATHTSRQYHEMTHTLSLHICEECGRGFTQPSALKTHMRMSHLQ